MNLFDALTPLAAVVLSAGVMATLAAAGEAAPATYTNPIGGGLPVPDPFVLQHDGMYYLYGTAGGREGFLAWTSPDLVHWEPLGVVHPRDESTWGTGSFWAPEVAAYGGKFFMTYSCHGPDRSEGYRLCLAVADSPAGPFRDMRTPWIDLGFASIDAHLFVDEGVPYLFFNRVGVVDQPPEPRYIFGTIYAVQLSEDLSARVGEPVLVAQCDQPWEQPDPQFNSRCNEGAFVFRHGQTYYLTYSSGHYASPRYGIGYATAPSPLGPWTKSEHNPLAQSVPALGVSGPGHSSITRSPDGREIFVVYHTHADAAKPGAGRVANIDRLIIHDDGRLELLGPTRTPQPAPSGARR